MEITSAYGMWGLVILNVMIFLIFAFSFSHPKTKRDWKSFGAFSAFIIALFTEMYGFPLTIYLLSGLLKEWTPGVDLFSHKSGHLLENFFNTGGDPHFGLFHIASYILIFSGFVLIANAWRVLHKAQQDNTLATVGPYALIRHPQYSGFIIIMFGFLLQWPTILTVVMFPILVWMYIRLAKQEELDAKKEFGETWDIYAQQTPKFIPKLKTTGYKVKK